MVLRTKINGSEALGSGDVLKRHKAIRFLIACQLSVSAGALFASRIDSAQAQGSDTIESPVQVKTDQIQQADVQIEDAPHKRQIMNRLGSYGLALVDDPESINLSEQFMVTADNQCAVQFGMTTDTEAVNVVTYLIGPVNALTNRRIYNLDGTKFGQTIHAEGEASIGVEFPSSPEDVPEVMSFLREKTDFFCNLLANHQ